MIKYFAYGSNISANRMTNERKINFINRKFSILENYKLVFNKVSKKNEHLGFANIIKCDNSIVEGVLYELNDSDISIIDKFEGAPLHYERKIVEVLCDNIKVNAIVYIANSNMIKYNIKPDKSYLNYILEGKDVFSDDYYQKLLKVETLD